MLSPLCPSYSLPVAIHSTQSVLSSGCPHYLTTTAFRVAAQCVSDPSTLKSVLVSFLWKSLQTLHKTTGVREGTEGQAE
ncbi:LOW QUALITY PROTEIN: hypothetical protein KIPB_001570 [Kipferlia bialata]|uniref:Uncharacterized protein n=1 Tax=Kipferlia bialata TaxID=797122 RepID=A0A9K3CP32_9EUKA|nr:LOW QUALITY PROTEIN: hypothetical protein KIPB_001570 [Kipferlia bialata]